jgi:peptide-methionine (S)-S-oxide reductase
MNMVLTKNQALEIAVFAGGCFWCMEAVFSCIEGVHSVEPGYTGGHTHKPVYEDVCTNTTGHAEAIRIQFSPTKISFQELLSIFFSAHNPTTLNAQGADVGSQYRSAIFYTSQKQKELALKTIQDLTEKEVYHQPIVTEIIELREFYPAEPFHHKYFEKNPTQMYCQLSIQPKVEKIKKSTPR